MLRIAAPAKLNLFLHITGKRADGYHLLESLVAFTEFGDWLEIAPAESLEMSVTGPFAVSAGEDNLVLCAARSLQAEMGVTAGAHITLHKHIPVGAGLGGGSADAAAALRGLMQLWQVEADMSALALRLGADVPVCMLSRTAWMGGIGEQVAAVDMDAAVWAVLVNPRMPLLTADVFRAFSAPFAVATGEQAVSLDGLRSQSNMLEVPAIKLLPVIGDMLAAIGATPDCLLARMSGSGATCFGLYGNEAGAIRAAQQLQQEHPQWWCVASALRHQKEKI